jgi:hypothetical protein
VYGRRRIGKTYLVKNYFEDKGLFFHITGIQESPLDIQLQNFAAEYSDHFNKGKTVDTPKDWFSAFQSLRKEIEKIPKTTKIILFFDELPWLATPRSRFLQALEHLWNRYLSSMPNVILIVCGSAASWMIDNVINHKGGLHGRVTQEIRLLPFTLAETEEFINKKGIHLDRKQIVELYMCLGGVAKYLSYLEKGKSVAQSVGKLCFSYNAPLIAEFHKLYRSLFQKYEDHEKIVAALAKVSSGLSYQKIVAATMIPAGGSLTKRLEELIQSGFITKIPIFQKGIKEHVYILIDEYSLFYLTWNAGVSSLDLQEKGPDYWIKQRNTQKWRTWTGLAFERLCLKHVAGIKAALGLAAVQTLTSKWRYAAPKSSFSQETGCEIDMIIDRADECINLCEIKFYADEFEIDNEYAHTLRQKKDCFNRITHTKKSTFMTLITSYGVKHNSHFLDVVDQEVTLDALFLKQ